MYFNLLESNAYIGYDIRTLVAEPVTDVLSHVTCYLYISVLILSCLLLFGMCMLYLVIIFSIKTKERKQEKMVFLT